MDIFETQRERRNNEDDLLITGSQAASLVGVSNPTFFKMAKWYPGLSSQPSAGGTVVWSLFRVLKWIELRTLEHQEDREKLVREWRAGK